MDKFTGGHYQKIQSNIRKNNIFGERSDYVVRGFLNMGGEAAFYMPRHDGVLIGRSPSDVYVMFIIRVDNAKEERRPTAEEMERIVNLAKSLGGIAIYGIDQVYHGKVKWFDTNGKKLHVM